ncbi:MAG: hypothetical protein ACRD45_22815 [Bryobacteraceae bacterium]
MTTTETQPGTDVVPVVSQATMALFSQMAVGIPEADDGEAYENIVLQLLNAEDLDAFNAPWDTEAAAGLAGQMLKIESMARRASDFAGGLGIYIVMKGVNLRTGEPFVFTTGGIANVASLARIHFTGKLPAIVELVIADTPTANGFRPQHLKIHSLGVPK